MSINFKYTIDINEAINNISRVEKKASESVDIINNVGKNINYTDGVSESFNEAKGIIGQLQEAVKSTAKISSSELDALKEQLYSVGDQLNFVEQENKRIIADLTNKRNSVYESRKSVQNGSSEAKKYDEQINQYNKLIGLHTKLKSEAQNYGVELDKINDDINKISISIDKQETQTQKATGSQTNFVSQLRKMKQELYAMQIAGDTTSETYKKLTREIVKMEDVKRGTREELTGMADINGLVSGMTALSGVTTAAAGAVTLFGEASEFVQHVTDKLNSLMSITIGLQQIQQQLLEPSAFKVNILGKAKEKLNNILIKANIIQRAETTSIQSNTVATQTAGRVATTTSVKNGILAKSFKAIGLAIKSIPVAGWILALLTTVVGVVSKIVQHNKKLRESVQKTIDETTKAIDGFAGSVAEHSGKAIFNFKQLTKEYSKLGNNIKGKEKFIKDNAKAFDDLGVSVKNVADADNLFIKNNSAFIVALQERAKTIAYMDMLVDEYKKQAKELVKDEVVNKPPTTNIKFDRGRAFNNSKESDTANIEPIRLATSDEIEAYHQKERLENNKTYKQAQHNIEVYSEKLEQAQKREQDILSGANITTNADNNESSLSKNIDNRLSEIERYKTAIEKFNRELRDAKNSAINIEEERLIAQEKARFEDEKKAIEKELKDIEDLSIKAGNKTVPAEITRGYNERLQILEKEHNDNITKIHREARDSEKQELEYLLSEYEDYNAKKISIDKKYTEDLANLEKQRSRAKEQGNENDVKRIEKAIVVNRTEYTKEVLNLDLSQLQSTPEYIRAFDDLKNTSTETLQYLMQELDKYKQTVSATLDPTDLREYMSTLQQLQNELNNRDVFSAISQAREELKNADKELADAEEELKNVLSNGGEGTQEEQEAILKVIKAKDKQKTANNKLKNSEIKLLNTIKEISSGFQDLGDAIGGEFGDAVSTIGSMGVSILGVVLQLKTLQVEADNTAAAITALETATVILAAITVAFQVIRTLYNTFFNKEDDSYEKATESLEGYIEVLDRVIDKEKELMNVYAGETGREAYNRALELMSTEEQKYRQQIKEYLNDGASWNSHSHGKEMSKEIQKLGNSVFKELAEKWNEIAGEVIFNTDSVKSLFKGRMTELVNLSIEQLEAIKTTDIWGELDSDIKKYINSLIDLGDEYDNLIAEHEELLTGLSNTDWLNEWLNGLQELDSSAEDVFKNIVEYMRKAMIKELAYSQIQGQLTDLYNDYLNYMDSLSGYTDEEREQNLKEIKERIRSLAVAGQEITDSINDLFTDITETSRSASNNAFAQMTQDSAERLQGMFTAVQGHTYDIRTFTMGIRDCAVIIQREITGIHVDTTAIVNALAGVNSRLVTIDGRVRDFEMLGIPLR